MNEQTEPVQNEESAAPAGEETPVEPATPKIKYDHFAKLDIRIGVVQEANPHPNADRLLLLKVQTGPEETRQIVAGIKKWYEPETLVGKKITVLCNLEPATIRGEQSQGMLLAASSADQESVCVLTPDGDLAPGSRIS